MAVVRNSLYLVAANSIALLIQFISIPIVVRSIGKTAFGSFTLIAIISGYFSVLVPDFGAAAQKRLTEAIASDRIQYAKTITYLHRKAIMVGSVITACLFAILCFNAPSIESSVPIYSLYAMCILAGVQNVVFLLGSRYTTILFSTENFKKLAIFQAVASVVSAVTSLTICYAFKNPIGLSIGAMLTPVIILIASSIVVRKHCLELLGSSEVRNGEFKDLARITLKAYPNSLILSVSGGADRLLIPYAGLPVGYVTDYNIPYRLPEMLVNLINPILVAFVPSLTRQGADSEKSFSEAIQKYSLTSLWLATTFVLLPSAFGGPFLKVWMGDIAPHNGEYVVFFIGLYMCLNFYYNSLVKGFVAKGEMHLVAPFSLFNAVATLACSVPAVRLGGIAGLAMMNALINTVTFLPFVIWTRRKLAKQLVLKTYLSKALSTLGTSLVLATIAFYLCNNTALLDKPIIALAISPVIILLGIATPVVFGFVDMPTSMQEKLLGIRARILR